ncbi:MAG TPA: response regulator [Bacteroidota bacterium]|nr:response regulator [Bacteroidota bacterium]
MSRILIIDDDEVQLQLERSILMEEGYTVNSTADGPQGIAIFRKHKFDLVLLDLGLPSMSGIEVLKEIRRIDEKAKVLVVTGYPSVESTVLAMRSGAYDYIQKPVEVPVLLRKIATALSTVDK